MNESLWALIEKARRYLHSAELLRAASDLDSAASRIYYAMFYAAEAALMTKGFAFRSHRSVSRPLASNSSRAANCPQICTNGFSMPLTSGSWATISLSLS